MTEKPLTQKTPRGRPPKAVPNLGVSPEEAARAMFSAVKPPDPKRRIPKRKVKAVNAVDRDEPTRPMKETA